MGTDKNIKLHIVTDIKRNQHSDNIHPSTEMALEAVKKSYQEVENAIVHGGEKAENIRWSSEPAKIEAFGEVKMRGIPGFLFRNLTPASLAQRMIHWHMRVSGWYNNIRFITGFHLTSPNINGENTIKKDIHVLLLSKHGENIIEIVVYKTGKIVNNVFE